MFEGGRTHGGKQAVAIKENNVMHDGRFKKADHHCIGGSRNRRERPQAAPAAAQQVTRPPTT
jgi:hypothetical protein